ncbi:TetR/AcrR family transcriptional regulator [Chengkuizengella axinellae]|uniref:TetR/AcrR family transcriptional regulator n=1 Tax=Chengkuizengella axinellae TaxID=3064388 RepID=A0ABT9J5H8_9BACL|nr:TetR/AcrR family transcriptional regulator [Chengkuizengella sp. 2205SS18-9]MDP5276255.1 TetR/AcrR family transcriptional regulator [Chengkuizengella sp. 2205SS18-9]
MTKKIELRSEETKRSILAASSKLFTEKGFSAVSIREIAKQAGCSHTTIYIYFKDKEALLHAISMPLLEELKQKFQHILNHLEQPSEAKLYEISIEFIHFCLIHQSMYKILFQTQTTRVDEKEPESNLNKLRNELFELLMQSLQKSLGLKTESEELLEYTRIYYYTLQGIVTTYSFSNEPLNQIMKRLNTTFESAFEVLLLGFKQKLNIGVD